MRRTLSSSRPSAKDRGRGDELMPRHAAITGWGYYVPERVLTNHDLGKLVETNDEWIRHRTGIRERRVAGPNDSTTSMCLAASRRALESARLAAADLDLVICTSTTPDHLLPATGCVVQQQLGAAHAGAFDLNSACTGFVYALVTAAQFIRAGVYDRVLVVAGETLTRFVNWKDRNTCILFGDGAGAVVVEATPEPCGVLSSVLGSRGDVDHLLAIEAGGAARPASAETVAAGEHWITMRGNEVFKFAVRMMSQAAADALAQADLNLTDLHQVIPHQANLRIIRATQEALEVPADKVYVNVDRYGNTGAASVPIALCELLAEGRVRPGDNLLLVAFGGGLTWAATAVRWADVPAVIEARSEAPRRRALPAATSLTPAT